MLHRAILGSLERFIGIYIEHTGGDFPFWLSPIQVLALPIADRHAPRAHEIQAALSSVQVRAEVDDRSETLGFRIRDAEKQKIPLTLVIGDEEVERGTVSPRLRKSKQAIDAMSAEALVSALQNANAERRLTPLA
jgi:threonyl-tRNA synthetase